MKISIFGAVVCLLSINVVAKPVYLDCVVGEKDSRSEFSVKVDEDTGKVTHTFKVGSAFNTEGFFAVDKITYQKVDLYSGIKMVRRYEISRIDLTSSMTSEMTSIEFPDQVKPTYLRSEGKCELVKVEERKF
ncbi:hypothetical protein [Pseudoalteromonas sp. S2755]|uniref:hypothetical protein n=1 Tax=Pseudoalteromonas sp. S2755 TaxID=2066523 RepID=UPI00110B06FE|nr:hypothetical protein [Pseudoalteromonas sp. S2755]TMN32542.1 hypothetical protein CWC03_23015 [Pseudoalteromonas sp. S2755]